MVQYRWRMCRRLHIDCTECLLFFLIQRFYCVMYWSTNVETLIIYAKIWRLHHQFKQNMTFHFSYFTPLPSNEKIQWKYLNPWIIIIWQDYNDVVIYVLWSIKQRDKLYSYYALSCIIVWWNCILPKINIVHHQLSTNRVMYLLS